MPSRRCGAQLAGARRVLTFALQAPADVRRRRAPWQAQPLGAAAAHAAPARRAFTLRLAGATTCRTRWPPPPRAGRRRAAGGGGAGAGGLRAGDRPLAAAAAAARRGAALTLVDDSYNANPDSVRAAIDVLAALAGPRWLVLGDMGEVGEQGPAFHAEVGAYARQRGIEQLWTVGALCVHAAARLRRVGAPLRQRRRAARRAGRGAAGARRCWSRARASCAWSGWCRRCCRRRTHAA